MAIANFAMPICNPLLVTGKSGTTNRIATTGQDSETLGGKANELD